MAQETAVETELPEITSTDASDCLECHSLPASQLLLCENCNIVLCQSCSTQQSHIQHGVKPFLTAAQETKNTVLAANRSTSGVPFSVNSRPGLRRAVSHTPTGRISPGQHLSVCRESLCEQENSLRDSKNRLMKTCLEMENLMRDDGVAGILKLRRLVVTSNCSDALRNSIGSPVKGVKLSRTVSSGHTALLNGGRDIVCAITNGLAKDGRITTNPGREVKLRLFFWSRDIRSRPPPAEHLVCTLENNDLMTGAVDHPLIPLPKVQIRQLRTDTFEASFRIENECNCLLHIVLAGQPVTGSPYCVSVRYPAVREEVLRESLFSPCSSVMSQWKNPNGRSGSPRSAVSGSLRRNSNRMSDVEEDDLLVTKIGVAGRDPGCFLNPQGICMVGDKFIAVTDSNIGCVQLFSLDGVFLQRFGERGRKPGQIIRPTGIALLPKCQNRWDVDVLVVADYENRTVVLFDMDGNSLTSFGSAKLTGPKGVAIALNGDIIVVDNRSNSLFVFRSCKLYKKIWAPSSSAAHLAGPHYVAVSHDSGDVLVSDFHHHTIKVFDDQYNYRWTFGSFNADAGMGSFSGPTGIAVDHRGIVVADWGSGRIQVFDSTGSFLAYVTTLSNPLYGPQGIALGQDGSIFACDSGNHTVRVYRHPLP